MIRAAVVEDQTLVRQGLVALLEGMDGVRVVGQAADGQEALVMLAHTPLDVLLLDIRMPSMDGLALLRKLVCPPATLVLTTFPDETVLQEAVGLGAQGFLLKDVGREELEEALRTVAAGRRYVQPGLTHRGRRQLNALEPEFEAAEPPQALTPKELDVLRLLGGGYGNRDIAALLGISEGTVKNHVSSLLAKLGVTSRTRVVFRAMELGLV